MINLFVGSVILASFDHWVGAAVLFIPFIIKLAIDASARK